MSKINELVEKLCPNGVEFKPIWSVTIWDKKFNGVEKFKQNKVISYKYFLATDFNKIEDSKGNIKYISTGISQEDRYTTEELAGDYLAEGEIVCIPWGGTPNIKYHKGKFVTGDNRIATSADTNILDNKYLYYWMCFKIKEIESFYRGSGIKHPNMKSVLDMTIAVPPLEVQHEIVHVLDDFMLLSAELSAELKARKKQYDYYREYLFNFNDNVEYKEMSELFPFIRNGFVGKVTPFFTDKEKGIRYLEGTNIHNGIISDNEELYVTKDFHEKHIKNELKEDDILMVQSGHIGECAVVGEKYKGANCHALIIMSNSGECLSKYVVHYFHTYKGFKSLTPAITGGTIKHVLAGKIGKVKIPCPSLNEQQRIVNLLDKLETITHDITKGLPAEIDARQKQYEYYRDKLLTFKELVNEG